MCFRFFFLFMLSIPMWAAQSQEYSLQKQMEQIDEQIAALELKKTKLRKKASVHLNKAHGWQFSSETSLDSRKEYDLAAQSEDKIAIVDLQIVRLKKEKEEICGG